MKSPNETLSPCPFCGGEDVKIEHSFAGSRKPVCQECGASLPPSTNETYAKEDWNTRAEVYITHPVTEEPMDKSQCKRVITQMYKCVQDMAGLIKDRDHCHEMADKLADAIAKHFGVEIGEHSNINCPWENALEWIASSIFVKDAVTGNFLCGHCGEKVENWDYCPNCGQRLD